MSLQQQQQQQQQMTTGDNRPREDSETSSGKLDLEKSKKSDHKMADKDVVTGRMEDELTSEKVKEWSWRDEVTDFVEMACGTG